MCPCACVPRAACCGLWAQAGGGGCRYACTYTGTHVAGVRTYRRTYGCAAIKVVAAAASTKVGTKVCSRRACSKLAGWQVCMCMRPPARRGSTAREATHGEPAEPAADGDTARSAVPRTMPATMCMHTVLHYKGPRGRRGPRPGGSELPTCIRYPSLLMTEALESCQELAWASIVLAPAPSPRSGRRDPG